MFNYSLFSIIIIYTATKRKNEEPAEIEVSKDTHIHDKKITKYNHDNDVDNIQSVTKENPNDKKEPIRYKIKMIDEYRFDNAKNTDPTSNTNTYNKLCNKSIPDQKYSNVPSSSKAPNIETKQKKITIKLRFKDAEYLVKDIPNDRTYRKIVFDLQDNSMDKGIFKRMQNQLDNNDIGLFEHKKTYEITDKNTQKTIEVVLYSYDFSISLRVLCNLNSNFEYLHYAYILNTYAIFQIYEFLDFEEKLQEIYLHDILSAYSKLKNAINYLFKIKRIDTSPVKFISDEKIQHIAEAIESKKILEKELNGLETLKNEETKRLKYVEDFFVENNTYAFNYTYLCSLKCLEEYEKYNTVYIENIFNEFKTMHDNWVTPPFFGSRKIE